MRSHETPWRLALAASVILAIAGLVPVPDTIEASLSRSLSTWTHLGLVRVSVALGGTLLATAVWKVLRSEVRPDPAWALLVAAAVLCAAANCVLAGKYLAGWIPNTWTNDVIELYAGYGSGLADLYAARHANEPPLLTPLYGPGYFFLIRAVASLTGGDTGVAARSLTGIGIVVFTVGAYLVARTILSRGAAALAPLLLIATFPALVWSGPPTKPEYAACALAILAFWIGIRPSSGPSPARWVAAGLLFGCALLVKFTIVAMPGALLLHLALGRRWRELAILGVSCAAPILATYAALWGPTQGGVWLFTVAGNAARPDLARAFVAAFDQALPLAIPALALSSALVWLRPPGLRGTRGAVAFAAVIAFGGFIATSTKPGSSANYLLEFAVVASIVLAGVLADAMGDEGRRAGSLVVVALVALVLFADLPRRYALLAQSPSRYGDSRAIARQLLASITPTRGQFVLASADFTREVIETGHVPLVYDPLQYTLMQDNGRLTEAPILAALRDGRVRHAVLTEMPEEEAKRGYGRRHYSRETLRFVMEAFDCRPVVVDRLVGRVIDCARR